MPVPSRVFGSLIFGWVVVGAVVARADWVLFAQGGQVNLPVLERGSSVELVAPWGGRFSFPRSAVQSITPTESLADEWQRRQRAAFDAGTVAARFEAGWWALEQGLTPEAVALWREASQAPGAGHHAPLTRVARMLHRLDESLPAADTRAIEPILGASGWNRLVGDHVVLLHQASPAEASERLDVLERVVTTFYLSLAAQGIELDLPHEPLVSVWFARQADYLATLRRIDAAPFATTQGFYHPGFRVVFAFDTRSDPDQTARRRELSQRRLSPNRTPSQQAEFDREALLLDLHWRSIDLGIAAHETVHQLVAASHLAPRTEAFPNWLHEGFAAQFEVVRDGRWAGIGRTNNHRLPDWRTIQPSPQLAPLLRDTGLTHGYHRDRYAEAWALVYFLRKTRPTEFVTFLTLLQTPPAPGDLTPSETAFSAAFGSDLSRLQAEWRRFMSAQTLPREEPDHRRIAGK